MTGTKKEQVGQLDFDDDFSHKPKVPNFRSRRKLRMEAGVGVKLKARSGRRGSADPTFELTRWLWRTAQGLDLLQRAG